MLSFPAAVLVFYFLLLMTIVILRLRRLSAAKQGRQREFFSKRWNDKIASRFLKISTTVSVAAAATILAIKCIAWIYTGSVAVLSSMMESLVHTGAALCNLVAVRYALRPATESYRFGPGKAEPLAGLLRAVFVAGLALLLITEALEHLHDPAPVEHMEIGVAIMVFVIILLGVVVRFQQYVAEKTNSTAIGADALQYKADVLMNAGVIVSLALSSRLGWTYADPVFAVVIAGYILYSAMPIARRAFHNLMDGELPDRDRNRIRELAESTPEVRGIDDLRTRTSGLKPFVQFRLRVDGAVSLTKAHGLAKRIEARIRNAFPGAEVFISHEPVVPKTGKRKRV